MDPGLRRDDVKYCACISPHVSHLQKFQIPENLFPETRRYGRRSSANDGAMICNP
jgi:hypothetical protein